MKPKIDLFRFATLRSPQTIERSDKGLNFIFLSNHKDNYFLKGIASDIDAARTHVKGKADQFERLSTNGVFKSIFDVEEALEKVNNELWNFSNHLLRNKQNITSLSEMSIPTNKNISSGFLQRLWNNVFYSIVKKENYHIRQACLQVIVAHNFLQKIKTEDMSNSNIESLIKYPKKVDEFSIDEKKKLYLRRLANATAVIPAAFTVKRTYGTDGGAQKSSELKIIKGDIIGKSVEHLSKERKQIKRHEIELARINISILTSILKEIESLKKTYDADALAKYNAEYSKYKKATVAKIKQYVTDHPEISRTNKATNNSIAEFKQAIPKDILPPFNFEYSNIFGDYAKDKLSKRALEYIEKNNYQKQTYSIVHSRIIGSIDNEKKKAAQIVKSGNTKIALNGTVIEKNTSLYDFSLSFHHGQDLIDQNTVFFLLTLDRSGAYFKEAHVKLTVDGKEHIINDTDKINKLIHSHSCKETNKTNYSLNILTALFSNPSNKKGGVILTDESFIEFLGEFILDNDVKLVTSKKGKVCNTILTGTSFVIGEEIDETHFKYQGLNNIGVVDFRRVEQELCCYIPGEVSHIENIMAKEYKEKSSRILIKSVLSEELSQEIEKEDLSDTTSTSRHEMNSEVTKVLEEEKSRSLSFGIGAEVHAGSSAWGFSVHADMHSDSSFSTSSSESNSVSQSYAEEVTSKALEKVIQRVKSKRTSTITREFEENYKHGYDNRKGGKHVTGVYRWVDKVYNNRLINYGKRLVYEFMIPQPAKVYNELIAIDAEEEAANGNSSQTPVKPDHPSVFNVNTPQNINRNNYSSLAAHYGVQVDSPKEQELIVAKSHSETMGASTDYFNHTYTDLIVDEDYLCHRIEHVGKYGIWSFNSPHADININIGGSVYERRDVYGRYTQRINFNAPVIPTTGIINLAIGTHDIEFYSITTKLTCTLKDSVYEQWQQDVYSAIMQAYNKQLKAYNDTLAQQAQMNEIENEEEKKMTQNPRFNEMTVVNELKRLSIELLMAPFENKFKNIGFYKEGEQTGCGIPSLKNIDKLDAYGKRIKFFEQAFDWNLMAKMFYDYYWSEKCNWKELFQSQDKADYLFQQFLQSSFARVIVPVREGFEKAVTYFIETGDIWNGTGLVINTDDDKYLSIVSELYYTEGVVEDKWQSVVPTSLTIIQGKSVYLENESLPCCTDIENIEDVKFKTSNDKLEGKDTTTS